jgi:hypothetical protein
MGPSALWNNAADKLEALQEALAALSCMQFDR